MTTKPVPWQQTFPKNTADEFTCLTNCRAIVMSQPQSTSVLLVQCPQWPAGNHWIGLPRNSCMEPHLTSNEAIPILDQNNICDMALLKFTDPGNDGNTIYVSFMQVHELHQCIPCGSWGRFRINQANLKVEICVVQWIHVVAYDLLQKTKFIRCCKAYFICA